MMLTLTARVLDKGKLIGYQLTMGMSYRLVTKQEAWTLAKNGEIQGVKATGTNSEVGSLSGTNGFEIKKLPSIKAPKLEYNKQDELASCIRYIVSSNTVRLLDKNMMHKLYQEGVECGIINSQSARRLSDRLKIENTVYKDVQVTGVGRAFSGFVGYLVSNKNSEDIHFKRITYKDHEIQEAILKSGQSTVLSKAELTLLSSKVEIGCTLSNAIIEKTSKIKGADLYSWLESFEVVGKIAFGGIRPIALREIPNNSELFKYLDMEHSGASNLNYR